MKNITIWKYPLQVTSVHSMPQSAKILHAGLDPNGVPCIWAAVCVEEEVFVKRAFVVRGTGWQVQATEWGEYIATYIEGPFVWHVFEVKP